MIDEGSKINVVSIIALQHLNISLSYFSVPTLAIRAFNNTLSTTLDMVVIPLKVEATLIPTTCHVVEGDMLYNIILDQPWIDEMEGILSSKHGYFKYLYKGKTHYISIDVNAFNHCNLIETSDPFLIPSLLPITILMNKTQNKKSSSSQVPSSLNLHYSPYLGLKPSSCSPPLDAPCLDHSKVKSLNKSFTSQSIGLMPLIKMPQIKINQPQ